MYINVAVLKETPLHERRVAPVPSAAAKLAMLGAKRHMQSGAGDGITVSCLVVNDVVKVAMIKWRVPTTVAWKAPLHAQIFLVRHGERLGQSPASTPAARTFR